MATTTISTFDPKWCPRVNASGDTAFRFRKAQYGDGYAQYAGDGINAIKQEWSLEFVGDETYIKAIKTFLENHAGIKSFYWVPPLGTKNLFRCEGYKPSALGNGIYSLSCTFMQSFAP